MLIRRLTPDDAPAFQTLRLGGMQEVPSAFTSSYAEEVDTPIATIATRLQHSATGAIWGAFVREALVGVVGIQREGPRQVAHKAMLWGMYVAPEHRRAGVARQLVGRALQFAATDLAVRSVNLGVNAANHGAIALYESLGFRIYGTEPGFLFSEGVFHDEHLMSRMLADAPARPAVPAELLVNIDVDDLPRAEHFYTAAFGLHVTRRFGTGGVELAGASSRLYLLQKAAGSRAVSGHDTPRDYARHWTPVHLDFIVADVDQAVARAEQAGARVERPVAAHAWGRTALLADPFGHGFCLIQFVGKGYDEISTHSC